MVKENASKYEKMLQEVVELKKKISKRKLLSEDESKSPKKKRNCTKKVNDNKVPKTDTNLQQWPSQPRKATMVRPPTNYYDGHKNFEKPVDFQYFPVCEESINLLFEMPVSENSLEPRTKSEIVAENLLGKHVDIGRSRREVEPPIEYKLDDESVIFTLW